MHRIPSKNENDDNWQLFRKHYWSNPKAADGNSDLVNPHPVLSGIHALHIHLREKFMYTVSILEEYDYTYHNIVIVISSEKPEEASCSGCEHIRGACEPPRGAPSPPGTAPAANKMHKYTKKNIFDPQFVFYCN